MRGHQVRLVIAFFLVASGLIPSWEWSHPHSRITMGMKKSPLVEWRQDRQAFSVSTSWDVNPLSASGALLLAGLLTLAKRSPPAPPPPPNPGT